MGHVESPPKTCKNKWKEIYTVHSNWIQEKDFWQSKKHWKPIRECHSHLMGEIELEME
jgi:hypothetical protein